MDFPVDLDRDSAGDLVEDSAEDQIKIIKILNKKNKEETEIHSQTLE
jgi:hypothetical protein